MKQNYVRRMRGPVEPASWRAACCVGAAASAHRRRPTAPDCAALRAACDAPAFATTLVPAAARRRRSPHARSGCRRSLLQWPGVAGRRATSCWCRRPRGALVAQAGEPVTGADDTLPLAVVQRAACRRALGAAFQVRRRGRRAAGADDPARVTRALRGQALVVREDDQGRVLDGQRAAGRRRARRRVRGRRHSPTSACTLAAARARASPSWAPTAQAVHVCLHAERRRRRDRGRRRWYRDDATGAWRGQVPRRARRRLLHLPGRRLRAAASASCATASPTRTRSA